MRTLWQDLRYGVRALRRRPGFVSVTVATLALGIGVNTALFTVFDALALRPLPLREPEALVRVEGRGRAGERRNLFSYPDYLDLRARAASFEGLAAWNKVAAPLGDAAPGGESDIPAPDVEYAPLQLVSENYFAVLGAGTRLGRAFSAEEGRATGGEAVVILSDWFWQRRFGSDPNVVGRELRLRGEPFTIVGVAERGFVGTTPDAPAGWVPLAARDRLIPAGGWNHARWLAGRDADSFALVGRLREGVTREQAEAELSLLVAGLAREYPGEGRKARATLASGAAFVSLTEEERAVVTPLLVAVGFVLLIACANVANLLLARGASRQKEIGVRLALGAQTSDVLQLVTGQGMRLIAIGLGLGSVAAFFLTKLLEGNLAGVSVHDPWSFGIVVLLLAAVGLLASYLPARKATRVNPIEALRYE